MGIKTKYTQKHIVKTLNVSQGTVSNWLNMKFKPTGLAKIALEKKLPILADAIERAWEGKNDPII